MASKKSVNPTEKHPRGVFRDRTSLTGEITFRVYRCDGAPMMHVSIHPDWDADQTERELKASLDARCPPDATKHHATCLAERGSRWRVSQ